MKKLYYSLSLLLLASACQSKPKEKAANPTAAGKHALADADIRSWSSYPVLLLVSTKYHMGVDTVAQVVREFDTHFEGDGVEIEPTVPMTVSLYEEETRPLGQDVDFFAAVGQRTKRSPAVIAGLITDFYLLSGSNRAFPERTQ